MESTGYYHINLFSFQCAEGLRCAVVNPLLISKSGQGSLRKTKTDKKDAMKNNVPFALVWTINNRPYSRYTIFDV